MGYINNARYMTGFSSPAAAMQLSPRHENILFWAQEFINCCLQFLQLSNFPGLIDERIVVVEDLFVNYGSDNMFPITT